MVAYTFPIDLASNGIPFGAKYQKSVITIQIMLNLARFYDWASDRFVTLYITDKSIEALTLNQTRIALALFRLI